MFIVPKTGAEPALIAAWSNGIIDCLFVPILVTNQTQM
jgi:hypothetical protein